MRIAFPTVRTYLSTLHISVTTKLPGFTFRPLKELRRLEEPATHFAVLAQQAFLHASEVKWRDRLQECGMIYAISRQTSSFFGR